MARRGSQGSLAPLAARLGHDFANPALLVTALTHPSAGTPARADNQRLEFLGDRVLGLIVARTLLETHAQEAEGTLAPRFNALVRRETLAQIATDIGLGAHLHLGRSENVSGGRRKAAILADALEAVIAALYLDGGMEAAERFVLAEWGPRIGAGGDAPRDPKTRLQEWAQARAMPPPDYRLLGRSGPDHAPRFRIAAALASGQSATGEATSKKQAEQEAAAALLARLGEETGQEQAP